MRKRPPGWLPPGPVPSPDPGDPELVPGPDETLDALAGHWRIFQLRRGHRYSTDDLITAWWAVSTRRPGTEPCTLLDLGCGVGSVMLLLLWRFARLRALGVEAQARSAALARRSVRYNGLQERVAVREADFRSPSALRADEAFDLVTASPPYLVHGEGKRSDRAQRGPCRFEDRGGVDDYLKIAERHVTSDGTVVWVHATRHASRCLEAADRQGLASVWWRRVLFAEGKESLISVFCAGRAPSREYREERPLIVRQRDGTWSEEYRALRKDMGFPW